MKRRLQFALLILLAVVLSACATGAKFTEVNPDLVSESPNMGRIFFIGRQLLVQPCNQMLC